MLILGSLRMGEKSHTDWTKEIRGRPFSNAISIIRFILTTNRALSCLFRTILNDASLTGHFIPGTSTLSRDMGHEKTRPSTAMPSSYYLIHYNM